MNGHEIFVQVFWKPHARFHDRASWNIIGVRFCDFDQFTTELMWGALIEGDVVYTRKGFEDDAFEIVGQHAILFARDGVDRCQLARGTYHRVSA